MRTGMVARRVRRVAGVIAARGPRALLVTITVLVVHSVVGADSVEATARAAATIERRLDDLKAAPDDATREYVILGIATELRAAADEEPDVAARAQWLTRRREELVTSVAGALDRNADAARPLVERAEERLRNRRRIRLLDGLLCKCPNEKWTRSLSGCWEPCRDAQVMWVDEWLALGHSDAEVIANMVERVGTPHVVRVERSWVSKWTPYFIFAAAGAFVVGTLAFLVRRGRSAVTTAPASSGAANDGADSALDARLEAELRQLED